GGAVGVILGTLLGLLASAALTAALGLPWNFSFPFFPAFVGIVVSTAIGLIFGIYPARRASQLDPIDALRYE
ncbi:MAG: FtsX-like permease family protein, partial [Patescibacteria group bacterium]